MQQAAPTCRCALPLVDAQARRGQQTTNLSWRHSSWAMRSRKSRSSCKKPRALRPAVRADLSTTGIPCRLTARSCAAYVRARAAIQTFAWAPIQSTQNACTRWRERGNGHLPGGACCCDAVEHAPWHAIEPRGSSPRSRSVVCDHREERAAPDPSRATMMRGSMRLRKRLLAFVRCMHYS